MAISFDETNDYYALADSSAMDFGASSEWCIGCWIRFSDNTGSLFQYIWSSGSYNVANTVHLFLREASQSRPGCLDARIETTAVEGNSALSTDTDYFVVVQGDGSQASLSFCPAGGATDFKDGTGTFSSAVSNGAFNLGRRGDGDADRYYGGVMGHWFKGDFWLSEAEITAIGNGATIFDLGYQPDCYHPMDSAEATIYDIAGVHNGTRNDSPSTVEGFPINDVQPSPIAVQHTAAPAGGGRAQINPLKGPIFLRSPV